MSKSVCFIVCQMFVYNIIMFISRRFVHVCIFYIHTHQDMNIVHLVYTSFSTSVFYNYT